MPHIARRWSTGRNEPRPEFTEDEVDRGTITYVVNATGEVQPVLRVSVGSFVSGPITDLFVDFNDHVKKDQLLAKIDPRIYQAAVERDTAALATRQADVENVQAKLQQALNDEDRARRLRAENKDYLSQTEMDRFHYNRVSLDAQLKVAEASVLQAKANLSNSMANLEYTDILSPVEGIVIERMIDPGQTLAAQFQAPELFIVAPDMVQKMHIFASVDETEIGLMKQAQESGQPVTFTVDAYPEDLFEGTIEQIRLSATNTQNVITYPVVVAAPNPDLKLMPGMTATLSFQIEKKEDILRVPKPALRYYPDKKLVREEDHEILEGAGRQESVDENEEQQSAEQRRESGQKRNRRHVWVKDGEFLRAIEVLTGIDDNKYAEVVTGDLKVGMKLITGVKPKS